MIDYEGVCVTGFFLFISLLLLLLLLLLPGLECLCWLVEGGWLVSWWD
jgi:hypothetical protein